MSGYFFWGGGGRRKDIIAAVGSIFYCGAIDPPARDRRLTSVSLPYSINHHQPNRGQQLTAGTDCVYMETGWRLTELNKFNEIRAADAVGDWLAAKRPTGAGPLPGRWGRCRLTSLLRAN